MNKKKILFTMIMLITVFICMQTNKVEAALQANGGTPAVKDVNGWITGIRQMQTAGQALGLTDTIDGTNLTSSNKNLDIHMQKNTEYGALVLLSASSYGNPNKIEDGQTTTGNKTGVVMKINKEWVAAGVSGTSATSMRNASGRYWNLYPSSMVEDGVGSGTSKRYIAKYEEKIGDGIQTSGNWHGAKDNLWLGFTCHMHHSNDKEQSCLLRAYSGSVFSYYGLGYGYTGNHSAHYTKPWASRAVVVVGSGV